MLQNLNKKITERPGNVYGISFLALVLLSIIFAKIMPSGVGETMAGFLLFLFWLLGIYICYIYARSKNRTQILWAILAALFWWFALWALYRLPKSEDGVF